MITHQTPGRNGNEIFWGEITPCEHIVQIYEKEETFLESLEGFIAEGIVLGEAVIVIATSDHLSALVPRLAGRGVDLDAARKSDLYIPLDAEKVLSKFMINGWPDEELFMQCILKLIHRARKNDRRVRAFGEMVAILWARGENGATVRLEHLWNRICESEAFCLFCAYPTIGFTQDADASIREICAAHSRVIAG